MGNNINPEKNILDKNETTVENRGPQVIGKLTVEFAKKTRRVRLNKADSGLTNCPIKLFGTPSPEREFFDNITLPLYKILFYSKEHSTLCDYVGDVKASKRSAVLDISSGDIYDMLSNYKSAEQVYELLHHYYRSISEFEVLRRSIETKNRELFCKKIEELNKMAIYDFCLFYKKLDFDFNRISSSFAITTPSELKYYLDHGVIDECYREKINSNNVSISLLNMGTKWIDIKLDGLDIYDLEEQVEEMLLYTERLHIENRYKSKLELLMKNPHVERLHRYAKNPMLRYDMDNESIFNEKFNQEMCEAISDVAKKYFEKCLKSNNTVNTKAQKSVAKFLCDKQYLCSSINKANKEEMHGVMTRFISELMNRSNVSYSSSYNEQETYQELQKKQHPIDSKLKEEIEKFNEFETELTEKMKNLEVV